MNRAAALPSSSANARSVRIDALRACAALMVLASHAVVITGDFGADVHVHKYLTGDVVQNVLGQGGVTIFFAISGYLIAGPFVRALLAGRPLPDVRRYLVRRFSRIFPAYWAALAAAIVFAPAEGIKRYAIKRWLVHFLLLQNFLPRRQDSLVPTAWTLAIEVMFYLAVPVAASLIRRVRGDVTARELRTIVGTAGLVSLAFAVWACEAHPGIAGIEEWVENLLGCGFLFCSGLFIAIHDAERGDRGVTDRGRAPVAMFLGGCAVVTVAIGFLRSPALYELRYIPLTLGSAAALTMSLSHDPIRHRVTFGLAKLGLISYGIYLWHYPVFEILNHQEFFVRLHNLVARVTGLEVSVHGTLGFLLIWPFGPLVVAAFTLPLAAHSWKLVEQPMIRWAHRFRASTPAPPAILPPISGAGR